MTMPAAIFVRTRPCLNADCMRTVRLLLALYAIVLGGCAAATNAQPQSGPQIVLTCEPSVQVGEISAVYVVAQARVAPLYFAADALDKNEIPVQPVDVDQAIEAAGGAGKLVSALSHLPSVPGVMLRGAGIGLGGTILAATVFPPMVGFAPFVAAGTTLWTAATARHSQLQWGYFGYPQLPGSDTAFTIAGNWKGYLFFPRRSYTTVEITVAGPKDRTETIKRPWR